MHTGKIANWVQVTATIGVIIGIALVVIELRQAKAMSRAQKNAAFLNPDLEELVLELLKEHQNTRCDDSMDGLRLDT